MGGLQIHPGDGVQVSREQCIRTGNDVRDEKCLDCVEVRAVFLPVIRVSRRDHLDTRVEGFERIPSGADTGFPVDTAILLCRTDGQVEVAEKERKISASTGELDDHRVVSVSSDIRNRVHDTLCGGFRIFSSMVIQGCDNICRIKRLSVVELDDPSQFERPGHGVSGRFPAFRKLANQSAILGNFRHVVSKLPKTDIGHVHVQNLGGIETVPRTAAGDGLAKNATLLRSRCIHCRTCHGDCQWQRCRYGSGVAQKFPACDFFRISLLYKIECSGHVTGLI